MRVLHLEIGLTLDLPMITEDEEDAYFTGISHDEFKPPSQTVRKFLVITFVILLVSAAKSGASHKIDLRWLTLCLS